MKDGDRGSDSHFLDRKRPTRTPRVNIQVTPIETMNFPNNAQMRMMFNRHRLMEHGGGGGGTGGGHSRRRGSGAAAFEWNSCRSKISNTFKRIRGLLHAAGLHFAGWRVWLVALIIYCCLAAAFQQEVDELLSEEEQITLYEWVQEVSGFCCRNCWVLRE